MKKLLSLILAISVVLGMTTSASAIVINGGTGSSGGTRVTSDGVIRGNIIKGINDAEFIDNLANIPITLNDKTSLNLDDLANLEVNPGDFIKIPMKGVFFTDANGASFANYGSVSLSSLEYARITAKTSASQGAGLITTTIGGNSNGSYIKLMFSETPSQNEQHFSYSLYLYKNGSRKSATRVSIRGVMETVEKEIGYGDTYVDLSDGSSVRATSTVRGVEVYLGEYCTLTRTMVKGAEYSGIALTDILNSDISTLDKYPEIDYVYRLQTINLKATGNIVTFDLGSKYFVYNTHGNYIGTTDQPLPYWTKYYLSAKKYPVLNVKAVNS